MCVCLLTRSFPFQINYFLIYLFSTFFDGFFCTRRPSSYSGCVCVLSLPTHHAAALAFVDKCYSRKIIVETDSLGRFTISPPTTTRSLHLPSQCLKQRQWHIFGSHRYIFLIWSSVFSTSRTTWNKSTVCVFSLPTHHTDALAIVDKCYLGKNHRLDRFLSVDSLFHHKQAH